MLLYIHIPFCDSKCGYCAFSSFVSPTSLHAPYFDALNTELKNRIATNMRFETVFIGGGTPNVVHPSFYIPLFERLQPYLTQTCEISMELNPNHLTPQFVQTISSIGVNRISLGAQSFNPQKLQWLERNHNPKNVFQAIDLLCEYGFDNLSIDLIYNTAFDDSKNLDFEVQHVAMLPLKHVSAYSLSIDEGSRFYHSNKRSFDNEELCHRLEEIGFMQYEVSNYTKNTPCIHNLGYWQHKEYLGIGLSSVSFTGKKRITNTTHLQTYINNPLKHDIESLSEHDLRLEQLFLGLRCFKGAPKHLCDSKKLNTAVRECLVRCDENNVYANNYFLADEIALFLES